MKLEDRLQVTLIRGIVGEWLIETPVRFSTTDHRIVSERLGALAMGAVAAFDRVRTDLEVLRWSGESCIDLIARLEARLASGTRFVVLVVQSRPPGDHDKRLLAQWNEAACSRMQKSCSGWATVVAYADVRPALLASTDVSVASPYVPSRKFAEPQDALMWLRHLL